MLPWAVTISASVVRSWVPQLIELLRPVLCHMLRSSEIKLNACLFKLSIVYCTTVIVGGPLYFLVDFGHFFNFLKIVQKRLENTPKVLRNSLKGFGVTSETFFKSREKKLRLSLVLQMPPLEFSSGWATYARPITPFAKSWYVNRCAKQYLLQFSLLNS